MSTQTKNTKLRLAQAQAPTALANLQEAHSTAAQFTSAQLDKLSLSLERDSQIDAIKKCFSPQIERLDGIIDRTAKSLKAFFSTAPNRRQFLPDKKSVICNDVAVAFRTSPGSISLRRGCKEADLTESFLSLLSDDDQEKFLNVKVTLRKDNIIDAMKSDPHLKAFFESHGIELNTPELCRISALNITESDASTEV